MGWASRYTGTSVEQASREARSETMGSESAVRSPVDLTLTMPKH